MGVARLKTQSKPPGFLIAVFAVVVVTLVLHLAGTLSAKTTLWGTHFFAFYPIWVGVLALALLALAIPLLARKQPPTPSFLLQIKPTAALIPTALVAGSVFWVWRIRHVFLGDASSMVRDVPMGTDFNGNHPLTYVLQQTGYQFFAPWFGIETNTPAPLIAMLPMALVSCLLGAVFVFVAWGLAKTIAHGSSQPNHAVVFLLTATVLTQGYMQLFFGYVENYTFYAVALTTYLGLALAYLQNRIPLVAPLLAMILTLSFHLSAGALLPSALFLIGYALISPTRRTRALRDLALTLVAAIALSFALGAYASRSEFWEEPYNIWTSLVDIATTALSGSQETAEGWEGYRFSLRHARDFANEQTLIGPFGLLFALFGVSFWIVRKHRLNASFIFLLIASGTYGMVSALAGDSNLGYARNWDLLAPGGIVFLVTGLYAFVTTAKQERHLRASLAIMIVVSLTHTASWVGVNASFDRGLARFANLDLGLGRTESTLATWYWNEQNYSEAKRWSVAAVEANPASHMGWRNLGLLARMEGNFPAAAESFQRATAVRPDIADYQRWLAECLAQSGKLEEALPYYENYLRVEPQAWTSLIQFGQVLVRLRRLEEAEAVTSRAQSLKPDHPEVLRLRAAIKGIKGD